MSGKVELGFEEADNGNRANQTEEDYLKDRSTKRMKGIENQNAPTPLVHGDQAHARGVQRRLYRIGIWLHERYLLTRKINPKTLMEVMRN